jgi:tight adherence protein B
MGFSLFGRDRETERKLEQISIDVTPGEEWRTELGQKDQADDSAVQVDNIAQRLDNVLTSRGLAGNIKAQLRKADLKLTVTEYLLAHIVLGVILGGALFLFRGVAGGALGFLGGLFIPRFYVSFRQNQRLRQFDNQLADILGLWVNALRAGYSVTQAMEAVSREAPPPSGVEFKRVVAEISIGIPMETALNNMLTRLASEDLDLVFTAVNIQREVGGNLAEILDTISGTIRERIRIKGEIRVLTTSGRVTGTLIGMLPVLLSILLFLINPDYMGQLFLGEPVGANIPVIGIPCGWPIVGIGLIMMAIGLAVIRRIVDIEV